MLKRSLFSKVFVLIILMSFIVGVFILVVTIRERTQLMEETLVQESKLLAKISSQIIETGYLGGRFPFQAIKLISDSENVLFLWIVKPDGEIYFADDPEMFGKTIEVPFLGTKEVMVEDILHPKDGQKIKLIVHPLKMELGDKPWSFYLGVSLESVTAAKRKVIFTSFAFFLGMIIVAALVSFYLAQRVTKPIGQLKMGTEIIGKGNLDYQIKLKTKDELEELGKAFNQMAQSLKKSRIALEESKEVLEIKVRARTIELKELTQSLEDKVKERTKELQERIEELEKFHRLTVGRELKMVELKKEIRMLKEKLEKHKGRIDFV